MYYLHIRSKVHSKDSITSFFRLVKFEFLKLVGTLFQALTPRSRKDLCPIVVDSLGILNLQSAACLVLTEWMPVTSVNKCIYEIFWTNIVSCSIYLNWSKLPASRTFTVIATVTVTGAAAVTSNTTITVTILANIKMCPSSLRWIDYRRVFPSALPFHHSFNIIMHMKVIFIKNRVFIILTATIFDLCRCR